MSGKGENNKNSSPGQGTSNQGTTGDNSQLRSNHGEKTGGKAAESKSKKDDKSANTDQSKKGKNKKETF